MRLIISTAPEDAAPGIARTIVEKKLAACVNILPKVRSIYRWEGKIEDDAEVVMFIKTTDKGASILTRELKTLHPYDVPEIICVEINEKDSNSDYLEWIRSNVG